MVHVHDVVHMCTCIYSSKRSYMYMYITKCSSFVHFQPLVDHPMDLYHSKAPPGYSVSEPQPAAGGDDMMSTAQILL